MFKLPQTIRDLLGTHGEIPAEAMPVPLFVTGNMRSGTTLLVNKLSQHPQLLKIGSELNDIWTAIGGADCLDHCEFKSDKDASFEYALNMGYYFTRFIQDSRSFKRHAMRFVNQLQQQQGRVLYDWQNIVPVNKSPHLMNKIGYVHAMFPKSKFIFIIRDIYGFSSSMKAHLEKFTKETGKVYVKPNDEKGCWHRMKDDEHLGLKAYPPDFSVIPEMWIRLNLLALTQLKELVDLKFLVVDYNDFVREQQVQLKRVFDFLNLKEKYKSTETKICKSVSTYKNTTTTGNSLTKWQKHLSSSEQEIIDKVIESSRPEYDKIMSAVNKLKLD
ncbi:MAG: sulfotransferase [Bacteroidales bacterium]|nr:sulfotransferase [Bacteroidales bacterium]